MIAALYVETDGCYYGLPGVDPWDINRDARKYDGPWPVVAHPPCNRWSTLAPIVYARHGLEKFRPGNDGGTFKAALEAVRKWGGVLEHPANSRAFRAHLLPRPVHGAWQATICGGWITEVAQCQYGHRARKPTWLYAVTKCPPTLDWRCEGYTHQIASPALSGNTGLTEMKSKEARATPKPFRDLLISIARGAQ